MNLEIRFTLSDQDPQTVPIQERVLIGTLLSNDVVIRTPGVEPIHAMIEVLSNGNHIITDLGSDTGVKINGKTIDVESQIQIGDVITIGDTKIDVLAFGASSNENFHTATTRMPTDNEQIGARSLAVDLPHPEQLEGDETSHAVSSHTDIQPNSNVEDMTQTSVHDEESMADSQVADQYDDVDEGGVEDQIEDATTEISDDVDDDDVEAALNKRSRNKQKKVAVDLEDEAEEEAPISGLAAAARDVIDEEESFSRSSGRDVATQVGVSASYYDDKQAAGGEAIGGDGRGGSNVKTTVRSSRDYENRGEKKNMLFSPRNAKPSGDVLEVVSYWGDTVLDVELFHPTFKGFEQATIGTPPKSHFLAGGKSNISQHILAQVTAEGFKLRLLPDMTARVRKGGKVGEKKGKGSIGLGKRDIAHVAHGPIKYFLMYVKPPALSLPRRRAKDPVFATLMTAAFLLYLLVIPTIYLSDSVSDDDLEDDIWSIVNIPEKLEPPKPEVKPKQEVAEVKEPPPQPKPPKPEPTPPKPVQPKEPPKPPKVVEKPKQPQPVTKPQPTKSLTDAQKKPELSRLAKATKEAGMVSTGVKKPDFKAPGKDTGGKRGLSGGPRGGGKFRANAGGARKGNSKADVKGVEGGAAGKASGVNLSKLGLGAGKILGKTGAGAIRTDFRNSAGGAGGGSGTASKTYGMGGPGTGRTLGVSGAGGAANNFGGFGGNGSGAGGTGGLGGDGIGRGFGRPNGGRGRAEVVVPPGDPVISGGLTTQEVQAVIRANLNQIRHCYEQLLQRSPSSSGKVKVNFVVQPSGRVGSAKIISSSINDSIMKSCITGKIQRWKFPQPRGGQSVTVNYPFVFNPL